jgi:hypothetical protein
MAARSKERYYKSKGHDEHIGVATALFRLRA